jgi:hypothetical protein
MINMLKINIANSTIFMVTMVKFIMAEKKWFD